VFKRVLVYFFKKSRSKKPMNLDRGSDHQIGKVLKQKFSHTPISNRACPN
jgi:hypothetical protein